MATKHALKPIRSFVYREAYAAAFEAADERGHTRLYPSMAEYREYRLDWRDYMAGWKAGMKRWNQENVA